MYKEHYTEHEVISSWQTILNKYREDKKIKGWFNKHYKILGVVDDVFKFIDSNSKNSPDEYIELIFKLKEKFSISVNKCKCNGYNCNGYNPKFYKFDYDVNGMCMHCGLKIKQ